MFQHDCNENLTNEVAIEDFEDETIEDFVEFLYQGKLKDEAKYTTDLLAMAHKYQVQAMQDTCTDYLAANVTKENVSQVWLVSETCEITKLIKSVHVFLAENWSLKKECDGLIEVIKSHPEYMIDLCSHINSLPKGCESCPTLKAKISALENKERVCEESKKCKRCTLKNSMSYCTSCRDYTALL